MTCSSSNGDSNCLRVIELFFSIPAMLRNGAHTDIPFLVTTLFCWQRCFIFPAAIYNIIPNERQEIPNLLLYIVHKYKELVQIYWLRRSVCSIQQEFPE
jgi:hypothetical protein